MHRPGRAALALVAALATAATAAPRVTVGPGQYRPVFPTSPGEQVVEVRAFLLDVIPVTNREFLAFVRANPAWRRGARSAAAAPTVAATTTSPSAR